MKCVAALDIATRVGWAIWRPDGDVLSGSDLFAAKSDPERQHMFWKWLINSHRRYDIGHVFYENPISFAGRGRSSVVVHRMVGLVETWAMDIGAGLDGVYPAQLKKFATGNGRADKSSMMRTAERRWSCRLDDDNEADALMILAWGMSLYDL